MSRSTKKGPYVDSKVSRRCRLSQTGSKEPVTTRLAPATVPEFAP
jgi:ribosomal protein S19